MLYYKKKLTSCSRPKPSVEIAQYRKLEKGANLRQAPATPLRCWSPAVRPPTAPPTLRPPASQRSHWQDVNERTNAPTNKQTRRIAIALNGDNKKVQQSWQTSALVMHLPLARLVSMSVIFCLLPNSSIVILLFSISVNIMCENCKCEYSSLVWRFLFGAHQWITL